VHEHGCGSIEGLGEDTTDDVVEDSIRELVVDEELELGRETFDVVDGTSDDEVELDVTRVDIDEDAKADEDD